MTEKDTKGLKQYEIGFNGEKVFIESGKMAKLANGSVTVRYGDTVILATAVVSKTPREEIDFFPLLVDYEERLYAAGKISGSRFIKRETRPSDQAILTCRLIDRPLRPLFPKNYYNDVQIIITVLSFDGVHDPDILSIIGASAALCQTEAPFEGPIAAARVGMIDGKLVVNPDLSVATNLTLDLVIAGTKDKVLMIETSSNQVDEKTIVDAIKLAQETYAPLIDIQNQIREDSVSAIVVPSEEAKPIEIELKKYIGDRVAEVVLLEENTRKEKIDEFEKEILSNFEGNYKQVDLKSTFGKMIEKEVRKTILEKGQRPDGRNEDEIRPISCEVGLLPRTHGSALFTRGQTQALTIATLGSPGSEQIIDTMEFDGTKKFMHHYNFPPFSTGEVKPLRGASRREIGHGALAEKAIVKIVPDEDKFPYTIRLVSEILSSNGSSSMAATCGSTLALMDAGVPIKSPVSGIAMGMVSGGDNFEKYRILTDIAGIEDFGGDMDFKVTGTRDGITAIQLDTKTKGLPMHIIEETLEKAKIARNKILDIMLQAISAPREEMSKYAPRIISYKINPEKIRDIIGSGGKTINKLINDAGGSEAVSIDIEDDGLVMVTSSDTNVANGVLEKIKAMTKEAQVGEIYEGEVVRILDFGAFVELWPGQDGMVHISELAPERVNKVTDVLKVGDKIKVKVIQIDDQGRINLSKKRVEDNS
ncbi:MAG: polyribonucleotide nucleotidyltransferase [Patescibacteria group bacterium]